MRWLHIGSSVSVKDTLPRALAEHQFDVVMTCNAGIKLYPFPDVFIAADGLASVRFAEQANAAQERGCKLVTLWRKDERARRERKVEHYDEFIEIDPRATAEFRGKCYSQFRFSGPLCLQYAVLNGATTLVIVGCDGWTGDLAEDYFDHADEQYRARHLPDALTRNTHGILAPAFRQIAEACPHVRFLQYGNPLFPVEYPNWEVVRSIP